VPGQQIARHPLVLRHRRCAGAAAHLDLYPVAQGGEILTGPPEQSGPLEQAGDAHAQGAQPVRGQGAQIDMAVQQPFGLALPGHVQAGGPRVQLRPHPFAQPCELLPRAWTQAGPRQKGVDPPGDVLKSSLRSAPQVLSVPVLQQHARLLFVRTDGRRGEPALVGCDQGVDVPAVLLLQQRKGGHLAQTVETPAQLAPPKRIVGAPAAHFADADAVDYDVEFQSRLCGRRCERGERGQRQGHRQDQGGFTHAQALLVSKPLAGHDATGHRIQACFLKVEMNGR